MESKIKTWHPSEDIEKGVVYRPKRGRKSVEGYDMDAWAQFVEFVERNLRPYGIEYVKATEDEGQVGPDGWPVGTAHTFATLDGEKTVKITEFHGFRKTRDGFEKGAIRAFRLDAVEYR